jgi:hypothetical protein
MVWIDAENLASVAESLRSYATTRFPHMSFVNTKDTDTVRLVYLEMRRAVASPADGTPARCLLVFDNNDDPEALKKALVFPPPANLQAHVLMTTRCGPDRLRQLGAWSMLEVSTLPPDMAALLLWRHLGREDEVGEIVWRRFVCSKKLLTRERAFSFLVTSLLLGLLQLRVLLGLHGSAFSSAAASVVLGL